MNESILTNPDKYFWLKGGKPIRSLQELAKTLPLISEREFASHVSEHKNDFSAWVYGVFQNAQLADIVDAAVTKEALEEKLKAYLADSSSQQDSKPVSEEQFSPEELDALTIKNDAISDTFDQAAHRLTEKSRHKIPENILKRLEILKEKELEVRQEISDARKEGFDLFIADIVLQRFPSRLALAQVTEDEKDFSVVEATIHETRHEITEARKYEPINIKKEVEELANVKEVKKQ